MMRRMKTENSPDRIRSQLSDRFQAMQERVGETARDVSRSTDEYVHENPWKSIAIVAAAAMLVRLIFGGSRRDWTVLILESRGNILKCLGDRSGGRRQGGGGWGT